MESGRSAADTIGKTLATAVNIASDAFFLLAEHADVALTLLSVRLGSSAIMGGINLLKAGVGYLQVSLAGLSVSAKSAVAGITMMNKGFKTGGGANGYNRNSRRSFERCAGFNRWSGWSGCFSRNGDL